MEICLESYSEHQLWRSEGSGVGSTEKLGCSALTTMALAHPPRGGLELGELFRIVLGGGTGARCFYSILASHWMWAVCTWRGHNHAQDSSLSSEERLSCEPPASKTHGIWGSKCNVSILNLVAHLVAHHSIHCNEAKDMATSSSRSILS